MSKYELKLEFDELPKSLNKLLRKHYWHRKAENEAWLAEVMFKTRNKLPTIPLQKCFIRVRRHHYRFLDFDGCVGSLKPVIDAVVTAGVIQDDSWEVTGQWDVDQVFRPKSEGPLLQLWIDSV